MTVEDEIRDIEARFSTALDAMLHGDVAPLQALLSHSDDATAFLGWGGYEQGGAQIDARWDWAMAQFAALREQGRHIVARHVEQLSTVATADLAYTTSIERATFSEPGRAAPVEQALRLTHIYRREHEGWKLVHRHADRLAEQRGPAG
jgi:ketosteroid isomerase-like protein